MKTTLPNNPKTRATLSKMIESGYYDGAIKMTFFEMSEKKIVNNYCVKGKLNSKDRFEVKADYCTPLDILSRIVLGVIVLIAVIMSLHWIYYLVLMLLMSIIISLHKIRCRREMDRFYEVYVRCKS